MLASANVPITFSLSRTFLGLIFRPWLFPLIFDFYFFRPFVYLMLIQMRRFTPNNHPLIIYVYCGLRTEFSTQLSTTKLPRFSAHRKRGPKAVWVAPSDTGPC